MFAGGYFAKTYFTGTYFPPTNSSSTIDDSFCFRFMRVRRRL